MLADSSRYAAHRTQRQLITTELAHSDRASPLPPTRSASTPSSSSCSRQCSRCSCQASTSSAATRSSVSHPPPDSPEAAALRVGGCSLACRRLQPCVPGLQPCPASDPSNPMRPPMRFRQAARLPGQRDQEDQLRPRRPTDRPTPHRSVARCVAGGCKGAARGLQGAAGGCRWGPRRRAARQGARRGVLRTALLLTRVGSVAYAASGFRSFKLVVRHSGPTGRREILRQRAFGELHTICVARKSRGSPGAIT